MDSIIISHRDMEDIISHAREGYPEEVCGILAGRDNEVLQVYRMTNTEHSPTSYFMDPKEQFRVMKEMRNRGLKMVGIYHSHPVAEAYPSSRDVSLAFYDDVAYLIISLLNEEPVVRAFEIKESKIRELRVEIRE